MTAAPLDRIEHFLNELKEPGASDLLQRIKQGEKFALAWYILAGHLRKDPRAKLTPTYLIKDYNHKLDKRVFLELVSVMENMKYLKKIPMTGSSKKNPLQVMMVDDNFIRAELFDVAYRVLKK